MQWYEILGAVFLFIIAVLGSIKFRDAKHQLYNNYNDSFYEDFGKNSGERNVKNKTTSLRSGFIFG